MIGDPWSVLGLEPTAGDAEIRRRYRELVLQHPPERDPERFETIAASYRLLRDPRSRARLAVLGPPALEDLEELARILRDRPRRPAEPAAWLEVIGE